MKRLIRVLDLVAAIALGVFAFTAAERLGRDWLAGRTMDDVYLLALAWTVGAAWGCVRMIRRAS